jgi:hypothetical protein
MELLTIITLVAIAAVATVHVFQLWARHQRRLMIHRERLAAIEKGAELPPLEQEIQRGSWNVQRLLLLAGLVWVSLGMAAFPLLKTLGGQRLQIPWGYDNTGNPLWQMVQVPWGLEWIGVALVGIGVSHLIVYAIGKQKEREESRRP